MTKVRLNLWPPLPYANQEWGPPPSLIKVQLHPPSIHPKPRSAELTNPWCWWTQMNSWSTGETRKLWKSTQCSDPQRGTCRSRTALWGGGAPLSAWMETFFLSSHQPAARRARRSAGGISCFSKLRGADWRVNGSARRWIFLSFFLFPEASETFPLSSSTELTERV